MVGAIKHIERSRRSHNDGRRDFIPFEKRAKAMKGQKETESLFKKMLNTFMRKEDK